MPETTTDEWWARATYACLIGLLVMAGFISGVYVAYFGYGLGTAGVSLALLPVAIFLGFMSWNVNRGG